MFKIGDRVYDVNYGIGKIISINTNKRKDLPIKVELINNKELKLYYTLEGKYYKDGYQVLFK